MSDDNKDGSGSQGNNKGGQSGADGSNKGGKGNSEEHPSKNIDEGEAGQNDQDGRGSENGTNGGTEGKDIAPDVQPNADNEDSMGATPVDSVVKAPSPSEGQAVTGGTLLPLDSGFSIPIVPGIPAPGGNTNKGVATQPVGIPADKVSGTKIITYTLIPLAVIAAVAYGAIVYRRRRALRRRRIQEDAEAAAVTGATLFGGREDDTRSVMSEVSYRPPAPYTSEVDITTERMMNNPEIVAGDPAQHLISAPKRDIERVGDYQDYSHVCQAQMMGKTCTNHSISCFVALNHSNGGLSASAAPRNPSTASSKALGSMDHSS
ncbi:hypothetical protein BGX28_006095 [Mortierella sp. GBA30]|nr:hypothetical protein BGX28_006095 [Mortierella sp. GBA30]